MLRKIFITLFLLLVSSVGGAHAFKAETFVTFGNPVRGPENWQNPKQDPLALPMFLYRESTPSSYPMTWLLRYDAVTDATMSAYFNDLIETDSTQSIGAFLEITPSLAEKTRILYPAGDSVFNANRIFLSGYSQEDRRLLIDTYMSAFFDRFGFYPKSVSAWHLDSYSLQYLESKYSVLIAMNCDDQYSMDHYRLWGGYLGSPYFPDKNNSLIPSSTRANRVNLAMVRWAQRDLFNFYGAGSESLYSVQVNDYLAAGQTTKYFEKLLAQYDNKVLNEFTYVNIGLENDYDLGLYRNEIKNVYKSLKNNRDKFNLHPISMADFGVWFMGFYPESSPTYFYSAENSRVVPPKLATTPGKVFWYQSPFYRIGFWSDGGRTEIIDFRVYNREIYEDYFATPNQSTSLYHEIPAIIDSVKYPGTAGVLFFAMDSARIVRSKQWDNWQISFGLDGKTLTLEPDRIIFTGFTVPEMNSNDLQVNTSKNSTVWEVSPHTPFKNTSRPTWIFWLIVLIVLLLVVKKTKKSGKPRTPQYLALGLVVSLIAGLTLFRNGLLYPYGMGFWGPNGHDAIFHLSIIEKFAANPFSFSHPQIAGENIANYHFLFDFISGVIVKVSGISSLDIYFRIFPIIIGITIIFLLDKLLKTWQYSRPERLLAITLAFLAGSFGFLPKLITGQDFFAGESAFWSNQSVSIFLNPPFALSIAVLLLFLTVIARSDSDAAIQFKTSLLPLSLLGAFLAQTKIYAFILLLGALLFSRKYRLFFGVLFLGILISLPFTVFGGPSPFIFSPLWFPRSLFASFDRFYWPQLVSAWQAYEASGNFFKLTLVNLFALLIFLFGNLGLRFLGLIEMAKSKSSSLSETIARWIVVFGLIAPVLFVQNINPWNTIQFMYYSLFFLAIYSAKFLSRQKIYLLLPLLLLFILTSVGTLKDYIGYFSASRISYTELLALEKLREQPKGVVLSPLFSPLSSRGIYAPKPLYSYISTAYISAISGQPEFLSDTINLDITGFNYIERSRDMQRFYNTVDKKWAVDFLSKSRILYVYETPLKKIKLDPKDIQLTKIFDSGEISIYKFN
ncbi:MAG: hypothetical protein UW80_C0003G0007 [Microgenomates group bacterium GW2011_GWC1_44_9]|nr:MAG: hypothetical protein UW80_C0003G0007 [Microgenomates group bacterium GW2011_GWC1_44_9]